MRLRKRDRWAERQFVAPDPEVMAEMLSRLPFAIQQIGIMRNSLDAEGGQSDYTDILGVVCTASMWFYNGVSRPDGRR